LNHDSPVDWSAKHVVLGLKCVKLPVDCNAGREKYMADKTAADNAMQNMC